MPVLPYIDPAAQLPDNGAALLSAKEDKANKGVADGYAPLDANAKVPTANLPDQASLDAEVDGKITIHNSATTSVHGIANTANLVLTNDLRISNISSGSINTLGGTSGSGGSINLSAGANEDGNNGGSIIATAGEGGGASGGTLNMSGGTASNTSGGNINTSGGNTENSSGGSINTSNGGGSINTRGGSGATIGGDVFTGGAGGSLSMIGGDATYRNVYPGGGGEDSVNGSVAGSINLNAGNYYNANGGSINLSGGGSPGYLTGRPGGSINLSNGGGSIVTSGGGGSIYTAGTGSIQLGVTGTRTTLNGSAIGDKTITLPNATGTVALTSHTHGNITSDGRIGSTADLPLITTTSGVVTTGSFGSTANSFCQGNDSRLSNARTPTAHKSSHSTGGSDALTPSDIGAQPAGSYAPATGISPSAITGTAVITTDSRLSDARTPTSHTHGNITNAGAIGSTANLPLITTTSGVVTTGSFGTTANSFCQGNDSRLSDSRTPTSHALSHAVGSGLDPITPSMIGASPTGHTHAISDVTSLQTTLDGKWISFPTSFAVWNTSAAGTDAGYFGDIEATGTTSSVALRSFVFPFNAKLVGASVSIYNTSTTNTLPSGATITISLYSKASEAATTATKVVDTNNWSLASNVAATSTTTNARTFTATDINVGTIYVMGISVSALPSASIRGKVVLYFR